MSPDSPERTGRIVQIEQLLKSINYRCFWIQEIFTWRIEAGRSRVRVIPVDAVELCALLLQIDLLDHLKTGFFS